jgi:hypothetical protein
LGELRSLARRLAAGGETSRVHLTSGFEASAALELAAEDWRRVVAPIDFHARLKVLYKAGAFAFAVSDRGLAGDGPDLGADCSLPPDGLVQVAAAFAGLDGRFRGIA